jgi:hypothetical protein
MKAGRLTSDAARAARRRAHGHRPGPRPFDYKFHAEDRTFSVRVTFRKSRATAEEIRDALKSALKNVS